MGKYTIVVSEEARKHLKQIYHLGNRPIIKKVEKIFIELSENPYEGTSKPEKLKYLPGLYSRRLNKKDRIVYSIEESRVTVYVISALGHYSTGKSMLLNEPAAPKYKKKKSAK